MPIISLVNVIYSVLKCGETGTNMLMIVAFFRFVILAFTIRFVLFVLNWRLRNIRS